MKYRLFIISAAILILSRMVSASTTGEVSNCGTAITAQAAMTSTYLNAVSAPAFPPAGRVPGFSVWRPIATLCILLGGLLVVARLLKRYPMGGAGTRSQRRMTVLERITLGQRQYLVLVRVDDKEMVLGVSPEHISRLATPAVRAGDKTDA